MSDINLDIKVRYIESSNNLIFTVIYKNRFYENIVSTINLLPDYSFKVQQKKSNRSLNIVEDYNSQISNYKELGCILFNVIFSNEALFFYRDAQENHSKINIRLELSKSNSYEKIPWEAMYDNEKLSYIALSKSTTISRYIETTNESIDIIKINKIRILVVIAKSFDIDYESERALIEESLEYFITKKIISLNFISPTSLLDLKNILEVNDFNVVHFICHGFFDNEINQGCLVIENDTKRKFSVSAEDLGYLLNEFRSIALVFLNSCHSSMASVNDPYSGIAQRLLKIGIPAIISMKQRITDRNAIAFSKEFYSSLSKTGLVGLSVKHARKSVYLDKENSQEWVVPVLYSNTSQIRLFNKYTRVILSKIIPSSLIVLLISSIVIYFPSSISTSGLVIDENGNPRGGVRVLLTQYNESTMTNDSGYFKFKFLSFSDEKILDIIITNDIMSDKYSVINGSKDNEFMFD